MSLPLAAKLIFFPAKMITRYPSQLEAPCEEVRFRGEAGILHGWFFPGKRTDRTLFFLHGNAGNIGDRIDQVEFLKKIGWNIFIFDYRGYGGSEGSPTIDGVVKDTETAYRWLTTGREETRISPETIILWGESLGGALAVHLAARETTGGVVLQGTFTTLRDMARVAYPFLPSWLCPDVFRSIDEIRRLTGPTLIIHGTNDTTVPFSMGEELFRNTPHPKRFHAVKGGHHTDLHLMGGTEYLRQVEEFLNEAGL